MALTDKQLRFVEEYLVDLNATQAAIRSGYSERTANEQGNRLLANASVQAAVSEGQAKRSERTQITADMVLNHWWDLSRADPNELIQYRRQCCRHCWGEGFGYQFTPAEFAKKETEASDGPEVLPIDPQGGIGFDAKREPNPDCPECHGEGTGKLHALDTRKLKGSAKQLYKGAKRTKDGLEILMHDQAKALENVAKHLGMFVERREVSGPGGRPVELVTKDMSPKEAADAYAGTINGDD